MYLWLGLKPKHIVAAFTGVNVYDDDRKVAGPNSAPILDQDAATTERDRRVATEDGGDNSSDVSRP